jgi:hypothetical protein
MSESATLVTVMVPPKVGRGSRETRMKRHREAEIRNPKS